MIDAQDAIEYMFLSLLEAKHICESLQASHFDYLRAKICVKQICAARARKVLVVSRDRGESGEHNATKIRI